MPAPHRVALISGGGHGIGGGIARRLVGDGCSVVVADIDPARRADAEAVGARFVAADVGDEAQVADLLTGIAAAEGRLDALVCNAGIMVRKPLADLTLDDWSRVLRTNLTSAFLLVRAAEAMLRAAKGAVVTIASTRAHMSEPNTESYAASKGAIVALTHALAVSLGPEVRVNCISPGWIDVRGDRLSAADHAQHPAGRVGIPADVASLACWLLGPESGFVTGAEFVVDGGMTRKMIYAE
jgi:NAD(P)-dependent dehydrogenase (short-subunit alcohol dehydrogenase family)